MKNNYGDYYFHFNKWILNFTMRVLILLFCTTAFSFAPVGGFSQEKIVIASDKALTVDEFFDIIKKQTSYRFIYRADIFEDLPDVELAEGTYTVEALINTFLKNQGIDLDYASDKGLILIKNEKKQIVQQRNQVQDTSFVVKGVVSDEAGPLLGASILIKNTSQGTVSDQNGFYEIMAQPSDTLIFSYIGLISQELPVNLQKELHVTLHIDETSLDEVVINAGYYKVSERERTGSISRITSKEIERQPVNNPLEAIQGRLTGVDIIQNSGVPGGGFEIKIRGQNSIMAGNEPLYIIDGVPFESATLGSRNTSGTIILSGNISPLNTINPEIIESIEVLKDADATAIYGSRGSNGVILITTKKGKQGKTKINFSTSTGIAQVTKRMQLLNTEQYLEMRQEAFANDGITEFPINAYDINGTWNQNRYTDWQKELIGKEANFQKFESSISGGNEYTQFLAYGIATQETTIFPEDFKYDRFSTNINLNHKNREEKLNFSFSTGYTLEKNRLPMNDLTTVSWWLPPNAPIIYDDQGNLNWEDNTWNNPFAQLNAEYLQNTKNLIANAVLSYKFLPSLDFKVNAGYGFNKLKDSQTSPHTIRNPAFGLDSNSSILITNEGTRTHYIVEPQLHWKYKFDKSHLNILIGSTFQEQFTEQIGFIGFGFPTNNFIYNLSAANDLMILDENESRYRYQSFFGRINYTKNDNLFLNITGRRDGSSRFGINNRFGNFGALGAAWIFSEKLDLSWLNYAKLRGSYGITGNDRIGDYQYLNTYTISNQTYDGQIGLDPSKLFNPNFKWEQSIKKEIGVELRVLDERFSLITSYYNNRSSNQLINYALPSTTGFTSILTNMDALVENSGWEFELDGVILNTENLNWSASINLSIPKNKLLKFPGLEESTYANRYVIGQPLSIVKLYKLNGVNTENGLFEFEDYNGDGKISNPEDRQFIADLSPKILGGLNNKINYKNWSLNIFFQFVKRNGYNQYYYSLLPGTMNNQPVSVLDRWQKNGDQANMQRFSSGEDVEVYNRYSLFTQSSGVISNASFVRLKSLELAYSVPMGKENTNSFRIALQGQNLFTFTKFEGMDPEQTPGFIPVLKKVNLNLQFQI